MQLPQQLPGTLGALMVTSVLGSVIEAFNLLSAAQAWLEMGRAEVPDLPADSAFDYRKRLQPGHMLMEQMDSRSGWLENSEMDEVRARVPRNTFVGALRTGIGDIDV